MDADNANKRVGLCETLAALVSRSWKIIIYAICSAKPIPRWEDMATSHAIELRDRIITDLRNYTQQITCIVDFWIALTTQHPELIQPNDKGYHFESVQSGQ